MNRWTWLAFVLILGQAAQAAEPPCVKVEKDLLEYMAYQPKSNEREFRACVRGFNVCVLTSQGKVLKGGSISTLERGQSLEQATLAVIQTGGSEPTVCLAGLMSGGGATSWMFDGWRVTNGNAVRLSGMWKGQLNDKAVAPADLVKLIFDIYEKQVKSQ